MEQNQNEHKPKEPGATPFAQTYFHGTKADLKVGEFIEVGNNSNYGQRKNAKYIFLTATLDAAIWGAVLTVRPSPLKLLEKFRFGKDKQPSK